MKVEFEDYLRENYPDVSAKLEDIRTEWEAQRMALPCEYEEERHDVHMCKVHGGAIDADSYDDFYRETSDGYCPDYTSRSDTPRCSRFYK
jgi:hypothetical protein